MTHKAAATDRKSAHMDETINELMHLKEDITSKLLEVTKISADLTQIQSCAEDQLREAFESSLQNIKREFVKKRKKVAPVVKQLEAASISLTKAEKSLQAEPRKSGSCVKKSRRRMRAARQILLESTASTSDLFSNIRRSVHDEIVFLREKMLDIPNMVNKTVSKLQNYNSDTTNLSDSDSDFSVDGSLNLSREMQYIPKLSTIATQNTVHGNALKCGRKESPQKTKTAQLNGVDLFTSESDSDEKFDTGKYIPIGPFQTSDKSDPNRGNIHRVPSIISDNNVILKNKIKNEFDTTKTNDNIRERNTTFNRRQDETAVNRNVCFTEEPICEAVNRLSRRDQTFFTPSPRSSQKRLLPSVPKTSLFDQPQLSRRSSEKGAAETSKLKPECSHFESRKLRNSSCLESENLSESFDREEFEFKETIKSTRQQILDKIKSKYHVAAGNQFMTSTVDLDDTCTLLEPCSSIFSESLDGTLTSIKDSGVDMKDSFRHDEKNNHEQKENEIYNELGTECRKNLCLKNDSNDTFANMKLNDSDDLTLTNTFNSDKIDISQEHPVYNWKRVEVFKRNDSISLNHTADKRSISHDNLESRVSKAIQKYETVSKCSNTAADSFRQSRSRSVTGPRIKHDRSFLSNKALLPRTGNSSFFDTPKIVDNNKTVNHTITFKRQQSTESNLNQICERDSRKAIRDVWRHRRSVSLTPVTPITQETAVKPKHTFDLISTILMPKHNSKCHVSGIAVLSNNFIVCLDEIHCCLLLFNDEHKYLNESKIMDVPSGITALYGNSFGIAYPFRSKLGIFKEEVCTIVHKRDIIVSCKEWVTDLSFKQDAFYVLCKGGHIHVISQTGSETKRVLVGVNGKLTVNQTAKRFYITGSGQVTRFDSDGNEVSRKSDISAFNTVIIGDVAYIGDRRKHKIVPLSDKADCIPLITDKVDYPSAIYVHRKYMYVSSFEETLDEETTRTIKVYRRTIAD